MYQPSVLRRRVFGIDLEHSSNGRDEIEFSATILRSAVIERADTMNELVRQREDRIQGAVPLRPQPVPRLLCHSPASSLDFLAMLGVREGLSHLALHTWYRRVLQLLTLESRTVGNHFVVREKDVGIPRSIRDDAP